VIIFKVCSAENALFQPKGGGGGGECDLYIAHPQAKGLNWKRALFNLVKCYGELKGKAGGVG